MTFCGSVPVPDPQPAVPSRTCGNCGFSHPEADGTVECRRDARGFDNDPVPLQRFPPSRGGCLYHFFARAS